MEGISVYAFEGTENMIQSSDWDELLAIGLEVNADTQVLDENNEPIEGLWVAEPTAR